MPSEYFKREREHKTTFFVTNRDITDEGDYNTKNHPVGEIEVHHGREVPNYSADRFGNDYGPTSSEGASSGQLFTHKPPKLDMAFVDHRLKAHTGTLAGMALNEARKTGIPTVSADLSDYSSSLARRGIALGVIQPNPNNPETRTTNDIAEEGTRSGYVNTDRDKFLDDRIASARPVSAEELQAGKDTVRGIARQSSSQRRISATQFSPTEQLHQQIKGQQSLW